MSKPRPWTLPLLFCVAIVCQTAGATTASSRPPNVVLIVADDLGWNAVGYHNGFVRTPNIDRIAHQGVELDRFYVSPMCSPTRAGLMTGRYAMRMGMARSVVRPWAKFGLPPEERTLPEALSEAGYAYRGAFGKWHLGHLDPKWHPLSQGFTEYRGCYNGAADYFTRDRDGETDWHHNWDDVDEKGYTTDLIADAAASFVREHSRQEPFFCYVAFTAPHEPLAAPQQYVAQYAKLDDNPADNKPSEKQLLAAVVASMDDGIGRILKSIQDAGVAENTLVWFISDNGGVRSVPGNNAPLRAGKLTVYEGGVRVPAAVWWPGKIDGGRQIQTPILNTDIMPTLVKLCGAKEVAPVGPLDGGDVLPALGAKGDAAPPQTRDLYFFTGQTGFEDEQLALITPDGWKLIIMGPDVRRAGGYGSPGHRVELYHLGSDPLEKTDRAAAEPKRVEELGKKLIAFRQSEPATSLPPMNRKPPQFRLPPKWHNAPLAASSH
ncbi:MAG TPA: sulfatase-like hydrolase/transferase [Tepidisphaeraceae bacterium]